MKKSVFLAIIGAAALTGCQNEVMKTREYIPAPQDDAAAITAPAPAVSDRSGEQTAPEAAPKEETAPAQPPAGESGAAGGGLFSGFGFKKAAKPRRERLVNVGGRDQQVILFNPKSFDEAGELVTHLEQNRSVVMTLEGVQNDFARRLLDFLSGITYAMHGKITPISAKTYFVTPQNVDILGAQAEQAESAGQSF